MKNKRFKPTNYSRGFYWGKKALKKAYREEGKRGLHKCDRASRTCASYGKDKRVKRTKKGKVLTPKFRAYYRGISYGMLSGYNEVT